MKCSIPEISWHNREPVLSVDLFPIANDFYRLASGGGDCHVLIWQLNLSDSGAVKIDVISDLTRHQRAINSVRWSPTGQYLATADDDANIIVWQLKTDNIPLLEGDSGDKETWLVYKVLRGHKEDVYDLCWSADGNKLFSGSVDNTAILWDLNKGKMEHILTDHKGFVQGVAWDPKNQYLASISTDRVCRLFDITGKQVKARIHKGQLPVSSEHYLHDKEVKYFHDDTFKSFFRRLEFSPDGSLLIVPSGHFEVDDSKKTLNATLIFTIGCWTSPAAILPLVQQSSTVVRFCPVLFELREDGPEPFVALPYRMIVAVGTDHDVIIYDTQQATPFARFHQIHYTRLTDLTWSHDGQLLIASSTDGFCSVITFELNELGVPYVKYDSEVEENQLDISGIEELEKDENIDINNKEKKDDIDSGKLKRSSFLKQWVSNTPKRAKLDRKLTEKNVDNGIILISDDDPDSPNKHEIKKQPRRIVPIKIESRKTPTKPEINKIPTEKTEKIENPKVPRRIVPVKIEEVSKTLTTPEVINKEESIEKTEKPKKAKLPIKIKLKDPTDNSRTELKTTPVRKKETNQLENKKSAGKKITPTTTNTLLKFFKSAEQTKLTSPNSNKLKEKKSKKKLEVNPPAVVEISLDANEANDAWKIADKKPSDVITIDDDDVTEDFCLQLEETLDEKKG